jgi:oligopeptide/dipeptide ABC transporter ATP-binding protein
MSLLELTDLKVQLTIAGRLETVVDGVSLSIEQGEALGLVGESGSGKSVTARTIIGLIPRDARLTGEIRFDGESVLALSSQALNHYRATDVSMVFQDPSAHINPVRRIGDFMCEGLVTCHGVARTEARQRVVSLLRETGIKDAERRLDQYPHELSGGLLQRVMIATALATEPRLLLADEPTTALDVTTQAEVVGILDDLRRGRGLAMLFITHDLDLAGAVCDRTAVMYAGTIAETNDSTALHSDPLHPYSAALGRSRPDMDTACKRLPVISGRPVAAFEAPSGCSFAPRCPFCEQRCVEVEPELRTVSDALVACHRAEEVHDRLADVFSEVVDV